MYLTTKRLANNYWPVKNNWLTEVYHVLLLYLYPLSKVSDVLQVKIQVVVLVLDFSHFLSQRCLLCVDVTAY